MATLPSINIGRGANAASSHGFVGWDLVGDEDSGAFVLFIGLEDDLLVRGVLGVDFPRIEVTASEEFHRRRKGLVTRTPP